MAGEVDGDGAPADAPAGARQAVRSAVVQSAAVPASRRLCVERAGECVRHPAFHRLHDAAAPYSDAVCFTCFFVNF